MRRNLVFLFLTWKAFLIFLKVTKSDLRHFSRKINVFVCAEPLLLMRNKQLKCVSYLNFLFFFLLNHKKRKKDFSTLETNEEGGNTMYMRFCGTIINFFCVSLLCPHKKSLWCRYFFFFSFDVESLFFYDLQKKFFTLHAFCQIWRWLNLFMLG